MKAEPNKIKSIADKNQTAKRIFELLSERQRNTKYTSFHGFRALLKQRYKQAIDRENFDITFLELERIGVGKTKLSPRKKLEGFYWSIPVSDIGKALRTQIKPNVKLISSDTAPMTAVSVVIFKAGHKPQIIDTDEKHVNRILNELRL